MEDLDGEDEWEEDRDDTNFTVPRVQAEDDEDEDEDDLHDDDDEEYEVEEIVSKLVHEYSR